MSKKTLIIVSVVVVAVAVAMVFVCKKFCKCCKSDDNGQECCC